MKGNLAERLVSTEDFIAEKIYDELTARPRSIVQLSQDLPLAPWKIFRAVHELDKVGRASYSPARGHWTITDPSNS
jgi:DNA-binding IclR family transcriptional regulator